MPSFRLELRSRSAVARPARGGRAVLNPVSNAVLVLAACITLAGCRLPGMGGPVSDSLQTSRQLSQQAIIAAEQARSQEAETLLVKAVKVCPTDPEARCHLAETLWQRGARDEALKQLTEACRLVPEDATVRIHLADLYVAGGQIEAARAAAEQAIELSPKMAAAWAAHARVMRAAGDSRQALADYHRSLGFAPENRQTLLEVAELYRQMNQPQRALESLQNLADTYPTAEEPQQVLYLTGLAHVALGRYDDGVENFAAAASRQRPSADLLYHLAEAQYLAGRPDDAAVVLGQVLAMAPQHGPSRELWGRVQVACRQGSPQRR
jgi:tetratricopeptide (TPR) repeat protein